MPTTITLNDVIARYSQEPDFKEGLKAAQAELEEELAAERRAFATVITRRQAPVGAPLAAPVFLNF